MDLQAAHEQLVKSVKSAEIAASRTVKSAMGGLGRTKSPPRPEEIAERPEVKAAYARFDALRAESEPKIAEMFGRMERIREILGKYNDA